MIMIRFNAPLRASFAAILGFVVACQSAPTRASAQGAAAPAAGPALRGSVLVANQQSADVSLIDLATGEATRIPVGVGPHETAISADGRWGVATIYGTQPAGNRLAIINMATKSVARTLDLGQYVRPHGVMFHPTMPNQVLVTSEATRNVIIVDIATGDIAGVIPTGQNGSHMLGVTADGSRVFTANVGSGTATELDVAGRRAVRSIAVAPQTEGIAVTPDGREIWVGSNQLGTVTVIDATTGTIIETISGFIMPYRLGASPDGKTIVVCDPEASRIAIVDRATRKVVGEVGGLGSPRGVMIAGDNRTALVTLNNESAVGVIDLTERKVLRRFPVGASPDGVAVRLGAPR